MNDKRWFIIQMNHFQANIAIPDVQQEELTLGDNLHIAKIKKEIKWQKIAIVLLASFIVSVAIYLTSASENNIKALSTNSNSTINEKEAKESSAAEHLNILPPPNISSSSQQQQFEFQSQVLDVKDSIVSQTETSSSENKPIANRSSIEQKRSLETVYSENLMNNNGIYSFLKKRISIFENHLAPYKKMPSWSLSQLIDESKISKQQFGNAIELTAYSPLILNNSERVAKALGKQQQLYESKYNISSYDEFQFCIVVPTYKNAIKYRYFLNLYTILQQEYTRYHVVIIDDASDDHTAQKIEKQLKDNPIAQQKVTLVKNKKRQYHMANIYHAVYDYCRSGEILAIVDGDDELIGRQVLKLFNAAYHRTKAFAIYSNHIESKKDIFLQIGISKPYPVQIIKNNSFREAKHYYSHLKTAWVDLFLQIQEQSLKSSDGKWYNNAVDNAIFLSIFQMSCGNVQYLPEITYKYNTFTGNSVANMEYGFRKATADEIKGKSKYRCINETRPQIYQKIVSYTQ